MSTLTEPKQTIYEALSEIETITVGQTSRPVSVFQEQPDEIVDDDLLCVTFSVSSNVPGYGFDGLIALQDIVIKIDVWALNSIESGLLLAAVEGKMREIGYRMVFNSDVADPKGYSHITTQFNCQV
jgi:hypothetical protein